MVLLIIDRDYRGGGAVSNFGFLNLVGDVVTGEIVV